MKKALRIACLLIAIITALSVISCNGVANTTYGEQNSGADPDGITENELLVSSSEAKESV